MDDLTSKVQEILGSEDGMKQLQEMARALGLTGGSDTPSGALSGADGRQAANEGFPLRPADLMQIQQLLQQAQAETPGTAFLRSLRPLLREERRRKVDEAIRILRLTSLLPALQQSGLLQNLLGSR